MADRIRTETGLEVPVVAVPFDDRTAKEVIEAQRSARKQALAQAGKRNARRPTCRISPGNRAPSRAGKTARSSGPGPKRWRTRT